jgi:fatty acid desaturase
VTPEELAEECAQREWVSSPKPAIADEESGAGARLLVSIITVAAIYGFWRWAFASGGWPAAFAFMFAVVMELASDVVSRLLRRR